MGCLIYEAAFDSRNLVHFAQHFSELTILKLAAIAFAFLLFFFLRRMLLSLIIAVAAYAVVLLFIH
jgi:CHASE2 domain-containing sensor protein